MTSPTPADDERLVRFARIVSHGMRNPLAIASGMVDLVERQAGPALDDQLRDLVRRSSEAVRRAADQLLGLQRYTSAFHRELVLDDVDVREALAAAIEEIDLAGATVDVDEPLPAVRADAQAVARALRELLDNAVRHGRRDGPAAIRVHGDDDGDAVLVVVEDAGPGIPTEQRAAAMEEGERLGQISDGFGLGLPTARILLARHGGDVRLETAETGGLRVVLRWPKEPRLLGQQAP